jgi:formiminotetrahydrofolate cyclodeaminase
MAIDADAESYNAVMKAYKSAKDSADGEREIAAALRQATNVPLGVAAKAAEVRQIAERLRAITNPRMSSDLTTAIALAGAALTGALANVDINLESLKPDLSENEAFVSEARRRIASLNARP